MGTWVGLKSVYGCVIRSRGIATVEASNREVDLLDRPTSTPKGSDLWQIEEAKTTIFGEQGSSQPVLS